MGMGENELVDSGCPLRRPAPFVAPFVAVPFVASSPSSPSSGETRGFSLASSAKSVGDLAGLGGAILGKGANEPDS